MQTRDEPGSVCAYLQWRKAKLHENDSYGLPSMEEQAQQCSAADRPRNKAETTDKVGTRSQGSQLAGPS